MKIPVNEWAMNIAHAVASRSECHKRQVGCVLLNRLGHIISTGYNGPVAKAEPCNEICVDGCQAIHAEINAIKQQRFADGKTVTTIVCTCLPCKDCFAELLIHTAATTLVYREVSKNSVDINYAKQVIDLIQLETI